MVGSSVFLATKFESFQVWGSVFILIGAVVASSDYFFKLGLGGNNVDDDVALSAAPVVSAVDALVVSAAVALYFISVVPSALSNIYKERKMKEQDMNEMHTSTIVSFWQLLFGFLFLPLMSLPAFGKNLSAFRLLKMSFLFSLHCSVCRGILPTICSICFCSLSLHVFITFLKIQCFVFCL
jgi:hypothetical protein